MRTSELMSTPVHVVSTRDTLDTAAQIMWDHDCGAVPVVDDAGGLAGMLTDRDICTRGVAEACDPRGTKARDIMSKGLVWCFDDQDIAEAAQKMEEKGIHHMPVMSREKRMIGVLSLSDLARKVPQTMFGELSRLAARDALRHAATPIH